MIKRKFIVEVKKTLKILEFYVKEEYNHRRNEQFFGKNTYLHTFLSINY